MGYYYIGILSMVAASIIARFINEPALKELTVEDKARLIEFLSRARKYHMIVWFFLLAIIFGAMQFHWLSKHKIIWILVLLIFFYLVITSVYNFYVIRKNNFPEKFIRRSLVATVIRFGGIAVFAVCMFLGLERI